MSAFYITVVATSYSGIGKGLISSTVCMLLKLRSYDVQYIKFDGYLNLSAGSLVSSCHGEVFVLDQGVECDLDLGHVERIAGLNLTKDNTATLGDIYKELINDQENGQFLGDTITYNPHITDKIISRLEKLGEKVSAGGKNGLVINEMGGSLEDDENIAILNAIRQLKQKHGSRHLIVLLAPVIWINTTKEFKTKLVQAGVKKLLNFGLTPDILICRADREVPQNIIQKISNTCNIPTDSIVIGLDAETIYQVPYQMYKAGLDDIVVDKLGLKRNPCRIQKYKEILDKIKEIKDEVSVGIVVKYENYNESYLSIKEALYHAGVANNVKVNIKWIDAQDLESSKDMRGVWKYFEDVNGILVPGGFSIRSTEGKIKAIKYSREKKIPFLGICLGLQLSCIEICRNLCGIENATSEEFDPQAEHKIIHYIPGQENAVKKGGNMRLGSYKCQIIPDTLTHKCYQKNIIEMRHRHRYEINKEYLKKMEEVGFKVSGTNPETNLVEIMELENHPFFIGTQGHCEMTSKLEKPDLIFKSFVEKCVENKNNNLLKVKE